MTSLPILPVGLILILMGLLIRIATRYKMPATVLITLGVGLAALHFIMANPSALGF